MVDFSEWGAGAGGDLLHALAEFRKRELLPFLWPEVGLVE